MVYINRKSNNPYFNIAAEEYVLKHFNDEIFMLWQNKPSVIAGKHQNTIAEINQEFIKKNSIPVIRRISGGGTVYHDLGNLNFTFVKNGEQGKLVDFRKYTEPIIETLKVFGIDAKFEGKNNLTVKGKKISGNAEHVYKNRVLHHGTLLFSSDLEKLDLAIKTDPSKYKDKAVKSINSKVTNIIDHLDKSITINDFRNKIKDIVLSGSGEPVYYELSEEDNFKINKLANDKYKTWEWNFGYSPRYQFKKIIYTNGQKTEFNLEVKNGIINSIKIHDSFTNKDLLETFGKQLVGIRHNYHDILRILKNIDMKKYFNNTLPEEIITSMF